MFRALINFSGIKASMSAGEVKDLDSAVAKDLLRAGYVEEITPARKGKEAEEPKEEQAEPQAKPKKRTTKKG